MRALITGIGGDLGQSAATVVRAHYPDCAIVGADMGDPGAGALLCDELVTSPRATDSTYLAWLTDTSHTLHVDIVVPCSDAEVSALSDADTAALPPLIMPNRDVVHAGRDKLATNEALATAGLAAPATAEWPEVDAVGFPCIIKPRSGQGSRGVHVVSTPDEAAALAATLPTPLLQELLTPADREMTCAVLGLSDGSVRVLVLRRRLAGGSTVWAKVEDAPHIDSYCRAIASALGLRGPMNVQLVDTESGPMAFEINPRLSSTVAMRDLLGFSDLFWAIEDALGREVPAAVGPTVGQVVVRLPSVRLLDRAGEA